MSFKSTSLAAASLATLFLAGVPALAQDQEFSASKAELSGQNLTVDITSPQAGWAVVYKMTSDGSAGDHIGHAEVTQGENAGVQISLTEAVADDTLIVMLHDDAGTKGEFEFGSDDTTDGPVTKDGAPVTQEITVK